MSASTPGRRPTALTLLGLPIREALLVLAVALVIAASIGVFAVTSLSAHATPSWRPTADELDDPDPLTDAALVRVREQPPQPSVPREGERP